MKNYKNGHGYGERRFKQSGTTLNDPEQSETVGLGQVTFSAKNERFTVVKDTWKIFTIVI
jgi:hypothetical protein